MGILDKLFGKKEKEKAPPARPAPSRRAAPAPEDLPGDPANAVAAELAQLDELSPKQLARKLGVANSQVRLEAARRLKGGKERSAMRPLMNAYLMYGDGEVLDVLSDYGSQLTNPVLEMAVDLSNTGERRARLMDMLAATGDEQALPTIRENMDSEEAMVRARACAALTKLGDLNGIARLDQDLQRTDEEARLTALEMLISLDHIPEAKQCVDEHVERFTAESGAVPKHVKVSAPRLDDAKATLTDYVLEKVKSAPEPLVLIVGSEAISWATSKKSLFQKELGDEALFTATRRMVPEEQIAEAEAARDAAAGGKKAVFLGMLPSPHDDPPLPEFLTKEAGQSYSCAIFIVDPHEYLLTQSWWHYAQDHTDVDTSIEVVLGHSRPGASAITQEEYDMYRLLKGEEQRDKFVRALLARM